MTLFAKRPDEVFTPRSSSVNEEMYVDRSELEAQLIQLTNGTKHVIIHGESGNGKTWLYKKVFSKQRTPYAVVNLANAARFGSIGKAISDKIERTRGDDQALSQLVVNFEGGFQPGGVGVGYSRQKVYDVVQKDPLEAIMMLVREGGKSRNGLIVFDKRLIPLSPGARDVVSGVAARQMFL